MRHAPASEPAHAGFSAIPAQQRVQARDGYPLDVRVWRPRSPVATLVMLHGVVSHAGWLDPVAARLAEAGIQVVCPDRRGSGRNRRQRGDAASGDVLLDDLDLVVGRFADPEVPLHLCGFCWGAAYALRYLGVERPAVRSLVLLAPGLYPAAELTGQPLVTGDSPEATVDPLIPLDAFTSSPALQDFILPDPLRLRRVSPRFNSIVVDFGRFITLRLARLRTPTLCVLAADDRITDNDATRVGFGVVRATPRELVTVAGQHGVQFDSPDEAASLLSAWIQSRYRSR